VVGSTRIYTNEHRPVMIYMHVACQNHFTKWTNYTFCDTSSKNRGGSFFLDLLYLGTDTVFMALILTFERLFSCMFHDGS